MLDHRPFQHLGQFGNDWLNARYHFSFADYHDPARLGWGVLRVWNDDTIAAGTGFAPHGHRDMEIVTYVRQGAITHQDNLGNEGRTEAGQVQVMSAGTGIRHAEYNRENGPTTLFQIWLTPRTSGLAPRWETRPFPRHHGRLELLASGRAEDGAAVIHQDAQVWGGILAANSHTSQTLAGGHAYLVAAHGHMVVNGVTLSPRDGLALAGESRLDIQCHDDGEVVLVDMTA